MTTPEPPSPLYQKHNSFFEIRQKTVKEHSDILKRIFEVCENVNSLACLSSHQLDILQRLIDDLSGSGESEQAAKFRLTPNVMAEIESLADSEVPEYLVHRYRYEMYPFLHVIDDYPPCLQIEPTSCCNYKCVFCYQTDSQFTSKSAGHMGHMSLDLFRRIVDQAEGNIEFVTLASRGEPLLCPDIEAMLAYTRGKFLNLKMNTNASLLNERRCHAILESGVKTIVFSVDTNDETLYGALRPGGKLKQVIRNIERFQNLRLERYKDTTLISRISGVKYSDNQDIKSMQDLWGDLVDQVVLVNYNPWENIYAQPATENRLVCSDLWRRMFVWWDGTANPCDVDYKSIMSIGSLGSSNLKDLWQSNGYSKLRSAHLGSERHHIEPCRRCSVI